MNKLRKTALHAAHRRFGAKMVNFGGWDLPVEYRGIVVDEHARRGRLSISGKRIVSVQARQLSVLRRGGTGNPLKNRGEMRLLRESRF